MSEEGLMNEVLDFSEIREKVIELEKAVFPYEKEMQKIESEFERSYKATSSEMDSQIWEAENAFNKSNAKLNALIESGVPRNKDGTVNMRFSAGKDFKNLQIEVPRLKENLEAVKKEAASTLKKLEAQTERTKRKKASDFNSKTAKLKKEITKLTKNYFEKQVQDKPIFIQSLLRALKKKEVVKHFEQSIFELREKYLAKIKLDTSENIIENYAEKLEFKDYKVKLPENDDLLKLIFSKEYFSLRKEVHFLRWGFIYVILLTGFLQATNIIGDFSNNDIIWHHSPSNTSLYITDAALLFLGCFGFLMSFFYKREKQNVYKNIRTELLLMKEIIDEALVENFEKLIYSSIKKDIGVDLGKFIDEIKEKK